MFFYLFHEWRYRFSCVKWEPIGSTFGLTLYFGKEEVEDQLRLPPKARDPGSSERGRRPLKTHVTSLRTLALNNVGTGVKLT